MIDEATCYEVVRKLRWPDGVRCLNCKSGIMTSDVNAAINLKKEALNRVGTTQIYAGREAISPLETVAVLGEDGSRLL